MILPDAQTVTEVEHYTDSLFRFRVTRPVSDISKAFPDKAISGIGGIRGFREAFNFVVHGAGNLQVCTAAMEEKGSGGVGIKLIQELKHDLSDYLEHKGYSSIEEIRGIARNRVVEHSQVRRKSEVYNCGYSIAS